MFYSTKIFLLVTYYGAFSRFTINFVVFTTVKHIRHIDEEKFDEQLQKRYLRDDGLWNEHLVSSQNAEQS